MRVPSSILSEQAETKVPGEPLLIPEEQGWRPYLPLMDDVMSSLSIGRVAQPVRFYTSEGVTEMHPPRSWLRRRWAKFILNLRFADVARLRNFWQEHGEPHTYVEALHRLGFEIHFRAHMDDQDRYLSHDPMVRRCFPALLPILSFERMQEIWQQLQGYFISVYENSLHELVIFTGIVAAYFFGNHLYSNIRLHYARKQLPLVIGGWGTRGKSGTERLKAALFNALGYSLVSKTTGCEAMFLYAHPYGETKEMFLFRPYDKATIWEQCNTVQLAADLGVEAFLWECMGLTDTYVKVLQRDWMQDDISTITNTYPDHENLQGPAGVNIPQVMTNFIPKKSKLLTSEELMRPILTEAAQKLTTETHGVGWLEAGLLTSDVLQRFPYEEHRYNIALALALAKELEIDTDFALKEMADRVVPDLGVLKTYPTAPLHTRRLEFTNGMSANERIGCIGNWERLDFDKQNPVTAPGVWVTTVVNNRADRIPRSQVFADILVNDFRADRHFLIGSNINGLVNFIRKAWLNYVKGISLWTVQEDSSNAHALQVLEQMALRFRLPVNEDHVISRLHAMLEGIQFLFGIDPRLQADLDTGHLPDNLRQALARRGHPISQTVTIWSEREGLEWLITDEESRQTYRIKKDSKQLNIYKGDLNIEILCTMWRDPAAIRDALVVDRINEEIAEDVVFHLSYYSEVLTEYERFANSVRQANPSQHNSLNAEFREILWNWFDHKIVPIRDEHASGNKIVDLICKETPPGFLNRIMGLQNIKGTGLDFVYCWQAWEDCYRWCALLQGEDDNNVNQWLGRLAEFQDYGLLCEEFVRDTLKGVGLASTAHAEDLRESTRFDFIKL